MRQNKTKKMLEYWMNLFMEVNNPPYSSGPVVWPDRSDVQPAQCRGLLGDMFILESVMGEYVYRLAGTQLCGMMGKELKQDFFCDVFARADQDSVERWMEKLGRDDYILLICSTAETRAGDVIDLETLLMPLSQNGIRGNRVLGITTACDEPFWLGSTPIVRQTIGSIRVLRPWEDDTFLRNWPFQPPASPTWQDGRVERRRDIAAPALFNGGGADVAGLEAEFLQQNSDWEGANSSEIETVFEGSRQFGHLTVLTGGRED